jgi:AP endonuclease-2
MKPLGNDKLLHYPFPNSRFRKWLRSMLREHGGPFFDAFRSKHPERVGAYTCFNQKVGAEVYNYGSRIDHILISGACFHHCGSVDDHSIFPCHVEECEIMDHFRRGNSENMSMYRMVESFLCRICSDTLELFTILHCPQVERREK